jgi:cytochrome P450
MTAVIGADFAHRASSVFAVLATDGPLRQVILPSGLRAWITTTHRHTHDALVDPRFIKDPAQLPHGLDPFAGRRHGDDAVAVTGRHLLNSDGDQHTRLRRLTQPYFTKSRRAQWQSLVEPLVAERLRAVIAGHRADLVTDYAVPIPVATICTILGIPAHAQRAAAEWSNTLLTCILPTEPRWRAAWHGLDTVIQSAVHDRTKQPRDDLITMLADAWQARQLSKRELTSYILLLLVAGYETTAAVIANGAVALLANPELAHRTTTDPAVLNGLVEETLRLDPPLPLATWRFAACPVNLDGAVIRAGDIVLPAIGAANRDPQIYPTPDCLLPARTAQPHLAFGAGAHYCLGAELGRLEARTALGALAPHLHRMTLDAPPEGLPWRHGLLFRRRHAVPVTIHG